VACLFIEKLTVMRFTIFLLLSILLLVAGSGNAGNLFNKTLFFQDDTKLYKEEMNARIEKNRERIKQLKSEIKREDKRAARKAERRIDKLEKRNKRLKYKIDHYDGKSSWLKFKKECDQEMSDLDEAVTDAI
jgi:septal ring factor EnvC (AmiA/AmiB activator)